MGVRLDLESEAALPESHYIYFIHNYFLFMKIGMLELSHQFEARFNDS